MAFDVCVGGHFASFGDGLGVFTANALDGSDTYPEYGRNCHQAFLNSFLLPGLRAWVTGYGPVTLEDDDL